MLGDSDVELGARVLSGPHAGAYLRFATAGKIQIATGVSYAMAEERLQTEDPGWDFDRIRKQAEKICASKLSRIQVKGGTEKERMLFYSCLYHSLASPRLIAKRCEHFTGRDGKIGIAEYDCYGEVPFWDTGRNQVVLLTLLEPDVKVDILRSQLDMALEHGYMGTFFHGDHAVLMYLGD